MSLLAFKVLVSGPKILHYSLKKNQNVHVSKSEKLGAGLKAKKIWGKQKAPTIYQNRLCNFFMPSSKSN
jgi:hypothetical protein